jgi:hypothetical protein
MRPPATTLRVKKEEPEIEVNAANHLDISKIDSTPRSTFYCIYNPLPTTHGQLLIGVVDESTEDRILTSNVLTRPGSPPMSPDAFKACLSR